LRRLVAAAADHRRACFEAGGLGRLGRDVTGYLRPFVGFGQPGRRDSQLIQDFPRPVTFGQVEQEHPRAVGLVYGKVAGQLEADIILGQQDVFGPGVHIRLVLAHPQNLGRGEAGQGVVAGDFDEIGLTQRRPDVVALRAGALVVPQDGRAQHLTFLVQQGQAVHLPGQPQGGYIGAGDAGLF